MKSKELSEDYPAKPKARLILTGWDHLFVENYDKVLRFDSERISLKTGGLELCVQGRGLWMEHYDKYDLLIRGEIASVFYPEKCL